MRYFKKQRSLWQYVLVCVFYLCSASHAPAALIVIGNKDIQLNQLTESELTAIYFRKPIELTTGETLIPIDQNVHSPLYQQFYNQVAQVDVNSVNRYWSAADFSENKTPPIEVNDDLSAIATVENQSKTIAYIDDHSLGAQLANVKVLYGKLSVSTEAHSSAPNHAAVQQQLAQEIATLRREEMRYQQLNEEREEELLAILRAEQKSPIPFSLPVETNVGSSVASSDLWAAMRARFSLTDAAEHSLPVLRELHWYLHNKWVAQMMINNSAPYIAYMYEQVLRHHVPVEFALLPMIESGYVPFAVSSAGASGLWQLMPETALTYNLKTNWWYDGRLDTIESTQVALDYLVELHNQFHTWALAAAAYDAGGRTVATAIRYNQAKGLPIDYWSLMLPEETQRYFPKLLALAMIINHPDQYGITLPQLSTIPWFTSINAQVQLDRNQIARYAGISEELVHRLNPSMLRFATDPRVQSYPIEIPSQDLALFEENLQQANNHPEPNWLYYRIQPGDSIDTIAAQYHINVADLQTINGLTEDTLLPGAGILVPAATNVLINHAQLPTLVRQTLPAWEDAVPLPQSGQASEDLKTLMNRLYNE